MEKAASSDGKAEVLKLAGLSNRRSELSEVLQDLYISGQRVASDMDLLQKTGITHIVNMAIEIVDYFPKTFTYLHVPARDYLNERLGPRLPEVASFVRDARKGSPDAKVLIHCQEGVSRSATAILACLMINEGMRLGDAMEFLKSKRKTVEPNATFIMELRILEREVFGTFTARRLSFFDPGVDETSGLVSMDWRQSLRNILGRASSDEEHVMETDSGESKLLWQAMRTEAPESIEGNEGVLIELISIGFEMFGGSDERDRRARARLADVLQEGYLKRQEVTKDELRVRLEALFRSDGFAELRYDVPLANIWAEQLLSTLAQSR